MLFPVDHHPRRIVRNTGYLPKRQEMWVILGQSIEKVHMAEIEPEPAIDVVHSKGQQ